VSVQLGGGLRSLELVRQGIELGADRLVIGTAAALEAGFLERVVAAVPSDRVAAGLDTRNGKVAVKGWTETSPLTAADLADRARGAGIATLIYTDISRDGMLRGPDIDGPLALQRDGLQVIASGGVSSLDDLRRIAAAGLAGAIVGRALYEGVFELAQALDAAAVSPKFR
jgi:phosphoribosylformimino-5-aminoimidazole carboxamide ribotide isomerase